jgi:hypothetical protein
MKIIEKVEATAGKLGLSSSEITRRSLRIALPILKDLALPGSPRRELESESEPPPRAA